MAGFADAAGHQPMITRRKVGFGVPIRSWLRHDLRDMVDDMLSPEAIRRRGLFDPAAVRHYIDVDRAGREDGPYRLWAFLTLDVWMRTFLDSRPAA